MRHPLPEHPAVIEEFARICGRINHWEKQVSNLNEPIALYNEALDHILDHPEAKQDYIDYFICCLNVGYDIGGVIEFCMCELHWVEIRDHVRAMIVNQPRGRWQFHLGSMAQYLDPEHSDRDCEFYRSFRTKKD